MLLIARVIIRPEVVRTLFAGLVILLTFSPVYTLSRKAAGKGEEEGGESDEPDLTASADLEDSR